ncbi:hypothetical protein [Oceanithermus desulfurans]
MSKLTAFLFLVLVSLLAACGGQPKLYSIGGSVTGLSGTLTLQNNGTDDLVLAANGPFTFATKVADGGVYNVTIRQAPAGQNCTVAGGSGTVSGASVTSVRITCTARAGFRSVGGSVLGLKGTLTLQNNGADDLVITADGPFTFATKVADGGAYDVTIKQAPTSQNCTLAGGSGTVSGFDVNSVFVACDDKAWYRPMGLSDYLSVTGDDSFVPRLALNTAGDALVVWLQGGRIYKAESQDGNWTIPADLSDYLSDVGAAVHGYPNIALNDAGDAVVVWSRVVGSNDFRIYKAERRGGQWTTPADLSDHLNSAGTSAFRPNVAMNASGDALVAWWRYDGSFPVYGSEFRDGSWSVPIDLSNSVDFGSYYDPPQVALNGAGDAIVLWSPGVIFKAERQNDSWTTPTDISDYLTRGDRARVALNDTGEAVAVWEQLDGATNRVYKAERQAGSWTMPVDLADHLSLAGTSPAYYPQVALNDAGDAVVVWMQQDGAGNDQIYKAERRGGSWTTPVDLADHLSFAGGDAASLQVALNDAGDAVVVWSQQDSAGNYQIYKAEYR